MFDKGKLPVRRSLEPSRRGFRDPLWDSFFEPGALFRDFFPEWNRQDQVASEPRSFMPAVDVYEDEKRYQLQVDLPGMKKDQIEVNLKEGILSISGTRESSSERKEKGTYLRERSFGSFERSFSLPEDVDPEKVDACFEDGVLKMTLPKDVKKTKNKAIDIH